MNYETFKIDCSKLKVFDFMKKWENHPKYDEWNQKKYDEDFEEWVSESYDYNPSLINDWKIFKNSCELYVKCLNKNK